MCVDACVSLTGVFPGALYTTINKKGEGNLNYTAKSPSIAQWFRIMRFARGKAAKNEKVVIEWQSR